VGGADSLRRLGLLATSCNKGGQKDESKDGQIVTGVEDGLFKGGDQFEGFYEISGSKRTATGGTFLSRSGLRQDNAPVDIDWPFTQADFEKLKEGMSLDEARKVLGLSTLRFNPSRSRGGLPVGV
jgi:hypothetical protein